MSQVSAGSCDVTVDGSSLGNVSRVDRVALLQQRRRREQEAACLLCVVTMDGRAKCSYSRYISYMAMQLIIAVRNDVQIIDVRLTTLTCCVYMAFRPITMQTSDFLHDNQSSVFAGSSDN